MKLVLFLASVLIASSAFAQKIVTPSPAESGRCGTKMIEMEAKCACAMAAAKDDIPDMLLNACRQSFGDDLKALEKYCKYITRDGSDPTKRLDSTVNECGSTYKSGLEELSKSAQGPSPVLDADVTAVSKPLVHFRWPYPFYWCWGWGWWWWWWIIRFYLCWYRHYRFWYRYCINIYPWLW